MFKYIIIISLGVIAGYYALGRKTKRVNYQNLVDECIENEHDLTDVFSKVLVLCKTNNKNVAIYAYQKYDNGKVTKKKITNDFDMSFCPQDIQEKLIGSNETIIYKF